MSRIQYREASRADVPAMAACRQTDPTAWPADPRMAAYLEGRHHPQQALPPRVAFVAEVSGRVLGYIAGHLTRRYSCDGEVQYLFVGPEHRRRGIAAALLRLLAGWFGRQGASRICVNVDSDSPAAAPFYASQGASSLNDHWYVWEHLSAFRQPDPRPPP